MNHFIARYKVKPERAAENVELIRAVYAELKDKKPTGLHYATFQLDDGVSFIHLASIDTEDGQSPLLEVEAFKRFQKDIVPLQLSQDGDVYLPLDLADHARKDHVGQVDDQGA